MQPLYLHFSLHHYLNLKVDMNKITFMMAAVLTLALTACGRSSSARSPLGDEGDACSIRSQEGENKAVQQKSAAHSPRNSKG